MKAFPMLLVLAALTLLALPAPARDAASTVEVKNESDWIIEEFFMSPSDDRDWGQDLLGDEVMEPGDSLTLTNIACDYWDLLLVDEDGDECVLEEVDLCGDRAEWDLTNDELLNCIEDTDG